MAVRLALASLVTLVTLASFALSCSTSARTGEATSHSAAATTTAGEAPGLTAGASNVERAPSPRLSDPLWIQAKDEDPLERARLAEIVGASGLLLGLEDGGAIAETALASLPYADDAEIALRRLGELALAADARGLDPLLAAILEIAGRPPKDREALDAEGARACGEAVVSIASRASLDRALRARAVSAARALAAKGYVDPARIPSDLDPPAAP